MTVSSSCVLTSDRITVVGLFHTSLDLDSDLSIHKGFFNFQCKNTPFLIQLQLLVYMKS